MYVQTSTNKLHEFARGLIQDLWLNQLGLEKWKLEKKISLIRAQYDPLLYKSPEHLKISMQAGSHYLYSRNNVRISIIKA